MASAMQLVANGGMGAGVDDCPLASEASARENRARFLRRLQTLRCRERALRSSLSVINELVIVGTSRLPLFGLLCRQSGQSKLGFALLRWESHLRTNLSTSIDH